MTIRSLQDRFSCLGAELDEVHQQIHLHYQLGTGGNSTPCSETFKFLTPLPAISTERRPALIRAINLLLVLAGVSYYKIGLAPVIELPGGSWSPKALGFFEDCYRHGLSELLVRNDLPLDLMLRFEQTHDTLPSVLPEAVKLPVRTLLPMGGGKDSFVALELLRSKGESVVTMIVGLQRQLHDSAKAAHVPFLQIERTLSPELAKLTTAGGYNGHVPVTAIWSALAVVGALWYGCNQIAMSLERSADEPTLVLNGKAVNHQYSKTSEFEHSFQELIEREVAPGLIYKSVLRPYSELAITAAFAKLPQYHRVFMSCNRTFRKIDPAGSWCCKCPKCRFVFLALAPFMPPKTLVEIFGCNMLGDPNQIEGFRKLISAVKPFECVGTRAESAAALLTIARQAEWQHAPVVFELSVELTRQGLQGSELMERALTPPIPL